MKNIFYLSFISCFLGFSQNIPMDSIPFTFGKNHKKIYIYCKVNQTDSLRLMVDTGASDLVIFSEKLSKVKMNFNATAENQGTVGKNTVKVSEGNTVFFGKQTIKNLSIISFSYPYEEWDGIVGLSVLKFFTVKIDYNSMQLYLFYPEEYKPPHKNRLKLKWHSQIPYVKIKIQTIDKKIRNLKLTLDTGSDRAITLSKSFVNKHKKLFNIYKKNSFASSQIVSSDGTKRKIYDVFFPKVKISNFETYKIPGGISSVSGGKGVLDDETIDGIMGNNYLKRFNITFDFENEYLYLEPNNYMYTPFYEFLIK